MSAVVYAFEKCFSVVFEFVLTGILCVSNEDSRFYRIMTFAAQHCLKYLDHVHVIIMLS